MPSIPELIFYTLVNILPLLFLALLPFRDSLRLPVKWVAALSFGLCVIDFTTSWMSAYIPDSGDILTVLSIFLYLAFYLLAVRAGPFKLLTVLLILMNFASVATVTSTFLRAVIAAGAHNYYYSWQRTLYYLAGLLLSGPLYYQTLEKRIRPHVQVEKDNRIWRYLWAIPAVFCIVQYYFLFTAENIWTFSQSLWNLLFIWVIGIGNLLTLYMISQLLEEGRKNLRLQQENNQLALRSFQYEALQKNIEETRRARHDLRQHFTVLQGFIENGDLQGAADYLRSYGETLPQNLPYSYCKNQAVNAVLLYYGEKAEAAGIEWEVSVRMGEETVIPEPELCVLVGNLLENAVEACTCLAGEKVIRVNVRQTGGSTLSITADNTCPRPPALDGERLRSSKHAGFGIGTESVRSIAAHYSGDARFEWRDGMFFASVMLNP